MKGRSVTRWLYFSSGTFDILQINRSAVCSRYVPIGRGTHT
jgi:hypothetical protein